MKKSTALASLSQSLLILILLIGTTRADTAAPATPEQTRRAFLDIIARPRVAPAADVQLQSTTAGIAKYHFTYASEAGQRVTGLLMMKETFSSDHARHPVVIAAHGTGGSKDGEAKLLQRLADKNFIAVAIDGRYHGERGNQADYNGAIATAFEKGGAHPLYYDTVWDLMRLVDYLQSRSDVDPQRIGLIGFSKGGIETWLTAGIDTRIACAVPCIGVQSFRWALENEHWGPRVATVRKGFDASAKAAGIARPDAAFVRSFYDHLLPGIYDRFDGPVMLPLIAPRALLTINGDKDDKNPLEGLKLCTDAAQAAYEKAGAADKFKFIIEPNTGHNVTADSMATAIDWFTKWIGGEGH